MGSVKQKCRKSSLSLEYTPKERLHDFVVKLKTKVGENDSGASSTTSTVAGGQLGAVDKHTTAQSKPPNPDSTCSYCQRSGHSFAKCLSRICDEKRGKSSQNTKDESSRQKPTNLGSTTSTDKTSPPSSGAPGKSTYCVIHKTSNHSTNDCYSVAKLYEQAQVSGHGNSQSGEGDRGTKNGKG